MSSSKMYSDFSPRLRRSRRLAASFLILAAGGVAGCGPTQEAAGPAAPTATAAAAPPFKTLHDGQLTVCLFPSFLPFIGQDAKGTWSGWEYAYLKDFAKQHGFQDIAVYKSDNFDGIWKLAGQTDSKCDIAASGISDLPERRKETEPDGEWTNTYYYVQRSFAVDQKASIQGLDDLKGKKVYVTLNSTADLDLNNRIKCGGHKPADFDIVRNNDEGGDVDQVLAGCAFAYGGGYGSILYLTKGTSLKADWTHDFMGADCKPDKEPFSFVVRKASTGLLKALNDYIGKDGPNYPGNQPDADPGQADHQKVECKK